MPRKLPFRVYPERNRHGKIVFYFRVDKGKRIRLPNPDDPLFQASYEACLKGLPLPSRQKEDPRTIAWLIGRYMESAKWRTYGAGTRRQRSNIFKKIVETAGHEPFARLDRRAIEHVMSLKADTPVQANNILKAISGLCAWAVRNGHMTVDPTHGVERLDAKSDGFPAWNEADVRKFCAVWPIGTPQRLALELALHTGLRRSDLCTVGRQHLRGNVLTIKTAKTDAMVTIELPNRVLDIIAATETGDLHFLVTSFGQPFTAPGFGNWFGEASRKAGIEKNSHGLRKLSATLAADGGATAHQLMSQFGWATPKQAEVYTRGADRARLGKTSSRIVSEQVENIFSPHPETGAGNKAKNDAKSKRI